MSNNQTISKILFVDFNGVISYDNYWQEISDKDHPLHPFQKKIEDFLFREEPQIVKDWMLGKYTSEQIHHILEDKTRVSAKELFEVFERGCRSIDISQEILSKIVELRAEYYCVLSTGNMDCFDRFTLPSNPSLAQTFNEIENSYNLGILKTMNQGQYFYNKAASLNVPMRECVVIDDSAKVCKIFEELGGRALCTYGVEAALNGLTTLQKQEILEYV